MHGSTNVKYVNLCHIGNFLMFVPATGIQHR